MNISTALPQELQEFFQYQVNQTAGISLGEGSLEESHTEFGFVAISTCILSEINSCEGLFQVDSRK